MTRHLILLLAPVLAFGQSTPTLKSILLEQLRTTHNRNDWFAPVNEALAGVTADQAKWTDGHGNHSVGQLANHLLFWNGRELAKFKGEKPASFNGNNDETFNSFDPKTWAETKARLDQVMSEIETFVEKADDAKLTALYSEIAHIGTHNAYHTGQIIAVRRAQGSWNPKPAAK